MEGNQRSGTDMGVSFTGWKAQGANGKRRVRAGGARKKGKENWPIGWRPGRGAWRGMRVGEQSRNVL